MLKINLLPTRRDTAAVTAADNTRYFAIAVAATLTVLLAALFLFHSGQATEVAALHTANASVEEQTRAARTRVGDHQKVRDELAEFRAREEAINHLEAARTGPTSMLVELSHLLSPGGRPSADPATLERIQRDNPTEMYNANWDPHRVWVTRFSEENRAVVIEGAARTADDVGEFMRRMMLSRYFDQVQLERSRGAEDLPTHIAVQEFQIRARVRY